jgi:hypothetical protein
LSDLKNNLSAGRLIRTESSSISSKKLLVLISFFIELFGVLLLVFKGFSSGTISGNTL